MQVHSRASSGLSVSFSFQVRQWEATGNHLEVLGSFWRRMPTIPKCPVWVSRRRSSWGSKFS